jgi:outer membrane protein TolC
MHVMTKKNSTHWTNLAFLMMTVLVSSCTKIGNYAEKRADIAAYENINASQQIGLGESEAFGIDTPESDEVRALLEKDLSAEEPELLSLSDVLAISLANSRSYKTRKETLFLEALLLTEVQKDFNMNFNGAAFAGTTYTKLDNGTVESFGDNGVDARLGLGVRKILATGANVSLGFTQNAFRYFTSPDTSDESTTFAFGIVQPLLRNFGPLVTKEPLRQAERDMIYAVRDFRRYQQDFVIKITSQYYLVLRSRDQLINERKNYESTIANREQTESYAKAGRIADFEASQARQSELDAADRWVLSRSNYQASLDDLRYTLGLPVDLNVEPNPSELEILVERGPVDLDVTLDDSMTSAISNRLDLINDREKVVDKERKLEIQRRDFLPDLNVSYEVEKSFDSETDLEQNFGVALDLPFDWTERRNKYRRAQITLEREIRSLEESEDNIRRTVRDLWRKLERNRSVYKNRLLSVKLAARRVENTTLLLKQGKALTRDLLDAQDSLLSSENQATVTLVDYTINRLRFWNEIERFKIDPKGMWYEENNEEPTAAP